MKSHFVFSNCFFPKIVPFLNHVEKYCRAGQATDGNIIWRTRIACWIPNVTNPHSEYVVLSTFPLQHWLHEGTSS